MKLKFLLINCTIIFIVLLCILLFGINDEISVDENSVTSTVNDILSMQSENSSINSKGISNHSVSGFSLCENGIALLCVETLDSTTTKNYEIDTIHIYDGVFTISSELYVTSNLYVEDDILISFNNSYSNYPDLIVLTTSSYVELYTLLQSY